MSKESQKISYSINCICSYTPQWDFFNCNLQRGYHEGDLKLRKNVWKKGTLWDTPLYKTFELYPVVGGECEMICLSSTYLTRSLLLEADRLPFLALGKHHHRPLMHILSSPIVQHRKTTCVMAELLDRPRWQKEYLGSNSHCVWKTIWEFGSGCCCLNWKLHFRQFFSCQLIMQI